jgi:AcrR family transcriptional regulator
MAVESYRRALGEPDGGLVHSVSGRVGGLPVVEMQRLRLLAAALGVVREFGYSGASVGRIAARARVSRRTFYELFDNREECLLAAWEGAVRRVAEEVAAAGLDGLPWRDRVRGGLWVILCVFDREPALARLCVVESQRGDRAMLERRQEVIERLAAIVDEGREATSRTERMAVLTAQGVIGAVSQVLYSRLLQAEDQPLRDLFGDLMGMIVLPYLGASPARREQARSVPIALTPKESGEDVTSYLDGGKWLADLPVRLTHRTALVLETLSAQSGLSNRKVAELAGISDQGQMSKLLSRLARVGLLENTATGAHSKGEPNQWFLTPAGQQVTRSIQGHSTNTHDRQVA